MLPFPSLRSNCKQANLRVIQANQSDIQANQSDIQANQSDIQANWSADIHYELPCSRLALNNGNNMIYT